MLNDHKYEIKERGKAEESATKMKILKKINKGLILTIIVLLTLTIYLVGVEKQRKADKQDIEKACNNFIEFVSKYSVLPEEMQELSEQISESKKEEYTKQIKTELEKIMISNEEAVKLQHQAIKTSLDEGYKPTEITSKIDRKITKISSYEFDGNQVTVTFNSKMETTKKYLNDQNEEQENKNVFESSDDEIILQKVDGIWKIVYSNLQSNNYDGMYTNNVTVY